MKTLADNNHKSLRNLKKEIVDNDEILIIVNETREDDRTTDYLMKDSPDKIEKLGDAVPNYMGENDLKILKPEVPDKWKNLTKKLDYPYEIFNSIDDCQKPVNNLKKEYFFSKLINKCPDDEEKKRTKKLIELFNIKNG